MFALCALAYGQQGPYQRILWTQQLKGAHHGKIFLGVDSGCAGNRVGPDFLVLPLIAGFTVAETTTPPEGGVGVFIFASGRAIA
jgi:hypothetical protein